FFLYCCLTLIWSDYPFTSFKRWVKDFGNVVMVLVILTEAAPAQALNAVFARYTYFAVPLSVIFIKYFPEFGRYYNRWTWSVVYCGIATEKNALGCLAFISGLFVVWDLVERQSMTGGKTDKADLLN